MECQVSISTFNMNEINYVMKGLAKIEFIATFIFSPHFLAKFMFVCTVCFRIRVIVQDGIVNKWHSINV